MSRLAEWNRWVARGRTGPKPSLAEIGLLCADLSVADLRHAGLYRANLRATKLQGANLRSADLYRADLHGANLRLATLRNASLRRANLQRADLLRADLRGADLYGSNLRYADLHGANLEGMLNAKELIVNDPRGCRLVVVKYEDGWRVFAGCRYFKTISKAIDHWSHPGYPNLDRGQRYVQALTNFAKEL